MLEIISHPDIKILMENLDKIDAAAHMASNFKAFLTKPKNVLIHDLTQTTPRAASSDTETTPGGALVTKNVRRKREAGEISDKGQKDLSIYEIWDGSAYCLLKEDETLPPSFSNTFPDVKTVCQGIQTDE
jgi:hypothetical protein